MSTKGGAFSCIKFSMDDFICFWYAIYAIREVRLALDVYSSTGNLISLSIPPLAVILGVIYFIRHRNILLDSTHSFLLVIPLFSALISIHSYTGSFSVFYHTIPMIIYLCMHLEHRIRIFDYFYWIVQANNIVSLLLFFCYKLSFDIGIELVHSYYSKWTIFAVMETAHGGRLCGVFNEPGGLGTICAILFIARFKYSKTWERVLLIVTTMCTLSLAGLLLIVCFLSVYRLQYSAKYIFVLIVGIISLFIIPQIDWGNEQLNVAARRLEIVDGRLRGDNRLSKEFIQYYQEFLSSGPVLLGYGKGYLFQDKVDKIIVASYKEIIVQYGFIGFIILITLWGIISLNIAKKNPDCIFLIIFFLVSLYQRPYAIDFIFGYVLLFGGMDWIQRQASLCKSICNTTGNHVDEDCVSS